MSQNGASFWVVLYCTSKDRDCAAIKGGGRELMLETSMANKKKIILQKKLLSC